MYYFGKVGDVKNRWHRLFCKREKPWFNCWSGRFKFVDFPRNRESWRVMLTRGLFVDFAEEDHDLLREGGLVGWRENGFSILGRATCVRRENFKDLLCGWWWNSICGPLNVTVWNYYGEKSGVIKIHFAKEKLLINQLEPVGAPVVGALESHKVPSWCTGLRRIVSEYSKLSSFPTEQCGTRSQTTCAQLPSKSQKFMVPPQV